MVGCVKYGLDCWMMDVEGKCNADAVARGLPACTRTGREDISGQKMRETAIQGTEGSEENGEWTRAGPGPG